MTISETILDGWTTPGARTNSKRTYRSIETALDNPRYGLEEFNHEYRIHLQGSYANHTNTWGGSDVDIVVKLTMPFQDDLSELSQQEQDRFWEMYSDIDYDFWDFHGTVHDALRRHYGREFVEVGDKAIKIEADEENPLPIDADVVACAEYRKYHSIDEQSNEEYTPGMFFREQTSGRAIVNYSEEHRNNGSIKNDHTNERYKPTVRMFKRARDHMVKRGIVDAGVTSSYYLEGLLYNVPHKHFDQSTLQDRYVDVVEWLESANPAGFIEQSRMYPLCAYGEPDRWNVADANATIDGFRTLWETY